MAIDPFIGALINGGASLLGNMFQADQSGKNQEMQIRANQDMFNAQANFSQSMLQQQQNFEQFNSNTAYTRARADMQNAGLNPMMMYGSGGSGASTPSVGLPSSPSPGSTLPGKSSAAAGIGPAVNQVLSSAVALRTADATINNLVEQNAKIKAETLTEQQRPLEVQAATNRIAADTTLKDLERGPAQLGAAEADAKRALVETPAGRLLVQAGYGGHEAARLLSPVSNLVSSARQWEGLNASRASRGLPSVGESFSDRFNASYGRSY